MSTNKSGPLSYPSPAEVKITINGTWVDDVYRVDYNVSTPRTPLYDYTSKFYKGIAEGHSIVQGQIIINYRFPNYLLSAIQKDLDRDPRVLRLLKESSKLYQELAQGNREDKINALVALKTRGALKPAKQVSKALYGSTSRAERKNETVFSQQNLNSFDLIIEYDDRSLYRHIIQGCVVIGEGQVISAAAMAGGDLSASSLPIYEVYNFFGKKVVTKTKAGIIKQSHEFSDKDLPAPTTL
jgi:hypothetical protein